MKKYVDMARCLLRWSMYEMPFFFDKYQLIMDIKSTLDLNDEKNAIKFLVCQMAIHMLWEYF